MSTSPLDTGDREMPAIHGAEERVMLTGMLEWYREGVLLKVVGMDHGAATVSPVRSGTTAAGLVKHLALVEDSWFTDRLAGRGEPEPWVSAPFARTRTGSSTRQTNSRWATLWTFTGRHANGPAR